MSFTSILHKVTGIKGNYEKHAIVFEVDKPIEEVRNVLLKMVRKETFLTAWDVEEGENAIIETLRPRTNEFGVEFCEGQKSYIFESVGADKTKIELRVLDPEKKDAKSACEALMKKIQKLLSC